MKKLNLFFVLLISTINYSNAQIVPPTETTDSITNITATTANAYANITNMGGDDYAYGYICYSTSPNPTSSDNVVGNSYGYGSYNLSLSGLTPNTTYYVRAYAYNSTYIISYGNELQFTTGTAALATISSDSITTITGTTAYGYGNILTNGNDPGITGGICYSSLPNPTINDSISSGGSGIGSFNSYMSGLKPNSTYYIRAYATNAAGTSYGTQLQFTTQNAVLASVTTDSINSISITYAYAYANILSTGNDPSASGGICYGTSPNPTTSDNVLGGYGLGSFSVYMSPLNFSTSYYVRAYVTNAAGTAYGTQLQFTTNNPILPTITTDSTNSITATTAYAYANLTNTGNPSTSSVGFCYNTSPNPTVANSVATSYYIYGGSFSVYLNGLNQNTTYYVKAYAISAADTAYGNELQFTTNTATLPYVTSDTIISNITATTADGDGNVLTDGGDPGVKGGLCFATSPNPTISDSTVYSYSTGTGSYQLTMSPLLQNTTYYARAFATNAAGTVYTNQFQFTTNTATLPVVTSDSINYVTLTTANVYSTVTDNGGDPNYGAGICYSTSPNPTIADSIENTLAQVNCDCQYTPYYQLSGLTPNTTYYAKAYVTNVSGTSYGKEIQFTTLPKVKITANNASICTGNTATLSASGAATYVWIPATGLNSTTDSTVFANPTASVTYTVIGTYNALNPNYSNNNYKSNFQVSNNNSYYVQDTAYFTLTVSPLTNLNSTLTPASICSGTTFSYTPTSSAIGAIYTWSRASVTGISQTATTGASNISEVLTNTTTSIKNVTYVYTTNNNGCSNSGENVILTVNPTPKLSSTKTPTSICSGTALTYTATSATTGTTFTWSRAAIASIVQAATTGTGNVNEILTSTNSSRINVTYVYTSSVNGCSNAGENVVVTVNPIPKLNSSLTPAAICSANSFSYTPTSATATSTFTWSRAAIAGIAQATNSGTGNVSEVLTNTTTAPVNLTYLYTTSAYGCSNTGQNVVAKVNPTPKLSSTLTPTAICSAAIFSYTATSATSGSTFTWSRATIAGISEAATTGTGNISEVLTNTTTSIKNVTYIYTTTSNGCSNSGENVIVKVNPTPKLSSTKTPTSICSGTALTYTATSATTGATFTWSRAAIASIVQAATTGTGNVNEILTSTNSSRINVTYVYTSSANGCSNAGENVVVTVNPIPKLNSSLTPAAICSANSFSYTPTSATATSTFTWSRAAIAGIAQATNSGTGNVSEVLTNTTTAPVNLTYLYTTSAYGCSNTGQNVVAKVNPTPKLSSTLTPTAICSATIFSYTATSATSGSTFTWSRATIAGISEAATTGTGNISEVLTNTTTSIKNVTYIYTTTSNGCSNSGENVIVKVNPTPKLSSTKTPTSICSGTALTYTATSATTGATFTWSRAAIASIVQAATTGTGNVNEILTSTNSSRINVTYVYTSSANGCSNAGENVVVTVNPIPKLNSSLTPAAICSANSFSYTPTSATATSTFTWSRAAIAGIAQATNSGTGNVSEVLTNTTTAPVNLTYFYTTSAYGCSNTGQNVVATVNPTPLLSSTLTPTAICSATSFSYTAASATAGASFSWSRATVAGISQAASTGTGNVSEVLTNTTTAAVNATYVYTTSANGCSNAGQNVIEKVNPTPKLSSTLTPSAICSANTFSYTTTSATAGATFSWSRATVAGISQAASTGTGNVSEVLTNTTTAAVNATYIYTTSANGCSNAGQNVILTVNPTPKLSSMLTPNAICSATSFSYTAASATPGATFSWSRATVAGISQLASTGTGNVSEVLTNTTTAPVNLTYFYTTSAYGCSNSGQNIVATVNPTPKLSSTKTPTSICSGTALTYTATSATTGATFTWSRAAIASIVQAATTGTGNVNEILTSTNSSRINVTYVYTSSANGCSNAGENVVVTVNPIPKLNSSLTPAAICSANSFSYTPTSATATSTFTWSRAAIAGIAQATSTGTGNVSEVLTNTTTAPVNLTYFYTTSAYGCSNTGQNIVATVNPTPLLSSTLTPTAICSATLFSYTAASATSGATFSWSRATTAGISEAATTGTGNMSEVLTNTTTSITNVTYVFTTSANGCSNMGENMIAIVNPVSSNTIAISACSYYHSPSGKYTWTAAGTYLDTINNHIGCDSLLTINLTINNVTYSSNILTTNESSLNSCNGYLEAVANGVPPYTYSWSDSASVNSPYRFAVCAGNYSVTIIDSKGCYAYTKATVLSGNSNNNGTTTPIDLKVYSDGTSNNNSCDGKAHVYVSGGIPPYSIKFGANTKVQDLDTIYNLCPGFYTVYVDDAQSQSTSFTFVVSSPSTIFNDIPLIYQKDSVFVDTLITDAFSNCLINFNKIDSIKITDFTLGSNNILNVTWSLYNNNSVVFFQVNYPYSLPGLYTLILDIFCTNRASGSVRAVDDLEISRSTQSSSVTTQIVETNLKTIAVYPNPFTSGFTVSNIEDNTEIKVYTTLGVLVYSGKSEKSKIEVNLENSVSGVYYLQVISVGGETKTWKLIKE